MAYHGFNKERFEKLKGAALTADEKDILLTMVADGHYPSDAIEMMGKSHSTLTMTLIDDPKFKKQLDKVKSSITAKVEKNVARLANGEVTQETIEYRAGPDGVEKLFSRTVKTIPPKERSQELWLRAFEGDRWNVTQNIQVETSQLTIQDPDEFRKFAETQAKIITGTVGHDPGASDPS